MMRTASATAVQHPSRFGYLMGLYGSNYWQLTRLFGPRALALGRYCSRGTVGLPLVIDVLERAPFTMELRLSYELLDDLTGQPDPSAHVRLYGDARLAEVTACYFGSRLDDVLGRSAPASTIFRHRLRMNAFFGKWLEYLEQCGHSRFGLESRVIETR
jgi:uncharacterized protein YqiB (DUF1249 family)